MVPSKSTDGAIIILAKAKRDKILPDFLVICGFLLFAAGLVQISIPLACTASGVLIALFGGVLGWRSGS